MFNSDQYLKKRGIIGPWSIDIKITKKFKQTIVIPAYGESKFLPNTLSSINKNNINELKETLVTVVINNSAETSKEIKDDNQYLLQKLENMNYNFSLGIIDASSINKELPKDKAGVGLARKIGIDLSLPYLLSKDSLIFCTDSDTIVNDNYIIKVQNHYRSHHIEAMVVGFQHQQGINRKEEIAIRKYEKFLLTTAKKINNSGSPYGYVSMGSTMVCTANAYCAIGGMPSRKATEDFYFLQELSKYCGVDIISDILVFPSSRSNSRVYLGTGFRMERSQDGFDIDSLYYNDNAFKILSRWIKLACDSYKINYYNIKNNIVIIHPILLEFLISEGIENIWDRLQKNSPSSSQFISQFHRWFDGLKTIRLLKFFSKNFKF